MLVVAFTLNLLSIRGVLFISHYIRKKRAQCFQWINSKFKECGELPGRFMYFTM